VRLRYCPDTQAYIQRRLTEGLSKREAIRCVKRYVARQTHHAIRADVSTTALDDLQDHHTGEPCADDALIPICEMTTVKDPGLSVLGWA
jgi:hypothetical protein